MSKTFTDMEWWYEIYDWELLGIIHALKEWQHHIQGLGHTMMVHMDHKNLTYSRKAQKLSHWQAHWALYLSKFNIKLQHLAGHKLILSDALSRQPDHCPDNEEAEEQILLSKEIFINLLDIGPQEWITSAKNFNFDVKNTISILLEDGPGSIRNDLEDWKLEEKDGQKVLFYKGKVYIPKDQNLQWDILKLYHDHEMAGHPGGLETYNSVWQSYWWPGLQVFVKNYVKGCGTCQQIQIDRNPSHPSFILVKGAKSTRPFAHCLMDLITDLPMVDGCGSLLVVVDQGLLKRVILCLTAKTVDMDGIGELLHENLYKWFGLPNKMLSYRGPQFAAKAFQAMPKCLWITSVLLTAYHPQTDSTTEWVNQEIEAYLAIYCHYYPETWKWSIPTLEFTHNMYMLINLKHHSN